MAAFNGPGGSNSDPITNSVSGSYYAPGTVTQGPNGTYVPYSSSGGSSSSTASTAASAPTPSYGNYGPNAQQLTATGNASPQALGAASIQSSAPPYQPVVNNDRGNAIQNEMYAYATNQQQLSPSLEYTYTPIDPNAPGTALGYNPITGAPLPTAQQGQVQTASLTQGAASQATPNVNTGSQYTTYNPYQATAAQGTVDPNSLIQKQFNDINQNSTLDANGVPTWATTAVTAAKQQMAALGLGSSTTAANATAGAILNTEMPMAQFNATLFANMNTQNLQNLQQTLLSNQAAINAAAQFNSQNQTQNNQFFQGLASNIAEFNTSQKNAMTQLNVQQANNVSEFNAGQTNSMTQFNAQQANAMAQFDTNTQNQVDEFNAQNQLLVDQSNVQWQRAVNTANTAGINAMNQANTQNLFNLTTSSLNNEWQQLQDQASWSLSAAENSQNRGLTLASSAMNQQTALSILNSQLKAQTFSQLGNLAGSILGGSNGIKSLFSSNNNNSGAGGGCFGQGGGGCFSGCSGGCFGGGCFGAGCFGSA